MLACNLPILRFTRSVHTGITHTERRLLSGNSLAIPPSRVASCPPCRIAAANSTASVIWRYPCMRARTSSGSSVTERSSGQNECASNCLSLISSAIASIGVTVWWTTDGLQETRMKPDSVRVQVAHPLSRCSSNHPRAASWWTWLGQASATRTLTSSNAIMANQ